MLNFSKKTKRIALIVLFGFLVIVLPGRWVLPKMPVLGIHFTSFYKYMDGFSFFGNKTWRDSGQAMYFPEGKQTYPTDAINAHFTEKKQHFVLVSDAVKLYASPTENAAETGALKAGSRVKATYRLDGDVWAFLIDPETSKPLGWCLDRFVGYQDRFSPVTSWNLPYLGMCIGEYCAEFTVSDTGAFAISWEAIGQGLQLSGSGQGQLYEYRGLVWVKQANPANSDELLMRTPEGGVVHELRRQKEPIHLFKDKSVPLRKTKKSVFSF